jgi:DnaK suppressor protein
MRRQLDAIDRAEKRVSAGTYGLSVESGRPIPHERLEAVPTAERTVEEEAGPARQALRGRGDGRS